MARLAFLNVALLACTMATGRASAQAGPSFDCQRASSVVERSICADSHLAHLDRELAVAYRQAQAKWGAAPQRPAPVRTQMDWFQTRDQACAAGDANAALPQGDGLRWLRDCLRVLYGYRTEWLRDLAEMDAMPGTIATQPSIARDDIAGRYVAGGSGWYGQMHVRRGVDEWSARIVSVTGLTSHVCSLEGRLDLAAGGIVLHAYLDPDARRPEELCRVTLMPIPGGVEVEPVVTGACLSFCGARGHFAGSYYRTSRMPK